MLDYTGKNAEKLKEKTLYLLDMDGTIYNENEIFDGTLDFLDTIRAQGGEYIFITNNSSKSVEDQPGNCHVSSGAVSGTGGLLYGNSLPGTGTSPGRH